MNVFNKRAGSAAALLAGVLGYGIASATTVTMTFDELAAGSGTSGQYVADYYDGGCGAAYNGGSVTCGGPDYGAIWAGAALDKGAPYGNNAPTTPNIMLRGTASNTAGPLPTLNVANGFSSGFSFWYSSGIAATSPVAPSVTLYSGLDGTGSVLYTTGSLAPTPSFAQGCPNTGLFPCWAFIGNLSFNGLVHSVVFNSPANSVAWDSISFDMQAASVPEPAMLGLFGFGTLLVGGFVALRRRRLLDT